MAIIIPRKSGPMLPRTIRGINWSSPLTYGVTSAGVAHNSAIDLVHGVSTLRDDADYNLPTPIATRLGRGLGFNEGSVRNREALGLEHLGANYFDGLTSLSFGVVARFNGLGTSSHEDTLFGQWQTIQSTNATANKRVYMRYDSANQQIDVETYSGSGGSLTVSANLFDGQFHWISHAWDGTNGTTYVDGVPLGTGALPGPLQSSSSTVFPEVMGGHNVTGSGSLKGDSPRFDLLSWFSAPNVAWDAELMRAWYAPQTRWDWLDQGTRRIFLPSPASAAASATVMPKRIKSTYKVPAQVVGINWASPLAYGVTSAGLAAPNAIDLVSGVSALRDDANFNLPSLIATPMGAGLGFNEGNTRNREALGLAHLGANYFDGLTSLSFGLVARFNGTGTSSAEDTLFGQWAAVQGSNDSATANLRVYMRYDSANEQIDVGTYSSSAGSLVVNADLFDGEFHWISHAWDGTNGTTYVDGAALGTGALPGPLQSTSSTVFPEIMGGHLVTGNLFHDSPRFDLLSWFIAPGVVWGADMMAAWHSPHSRWDWLNQGSRVITLGSAATTTAATVIRVPT